MGSSIPKERMRGAGQLREQFSQEELGTIVLSLHYERLRNRSGQWGYWIFGALEAETIRRDPNFKTLNTIRKWLEENGFSISMEEGDWQHYLEYVFDYFAQFGQRPIPCQIKSKMLLRRYRAKEFLPKSQPAPRTYGQLKEIYQRIIGSRAHLSVGAG